MQRGRPDDREADREAAGLRPWSSLAETPNTQGAFSAPRNTESFTTLTSAYRVRPRVEGPGAVASAEGSLPSIRPHHAAAPEPALLPVSGPIVGSENAPLGSAGRLTPVKSPFTSPDASRPTAKRRLAGSERIVRCTVGPRFRLKASRPALKELLLSAVEVRGPESVLVE